jgi:hypothetical protein
MGECSIALSEFVLSTIIEVQAHFGFFDFDGDPDEITMHIGIEPDVVMRKGDEFPDRGGRLRTRLFNSWGVSGSSTSKDVSDHLGELLGRLGPLHPDLPPEFGVPGFTVTWKGNYLYAGSGPQYDPAVISGIADWAAELGHDIDQIDQEQTEPVDGLWRLPRW